MKRKLNRPKENLKITNRYPTPKNSLDELNSKMKMTEKKLSALENRPIKLWNLKNREKKRFRGKKKVSGPADWHTKC